MQSNLNTLTNELVNNYGPLVSSICHRMIKNDEDAKDAAQEVWLEVVKGLPNFRGDALLSTWIYTVAYHTVTRFSQKEKKYSTKFLREYFHQEQLEVPSDIDYDQKIWIKEMCDRCLTGILHCLDQESRLVYLFKDVVGLSYDDIALIIDKQPATVRKMVSRCRGKLKNFLNKECILYNPSGNCKCRMRDLVAEINLPHEYHKLRQLVKEVNLYQESCQIIPQKNYWEKYLI